MKLTILGSGTGVPSADRNSAGYFVEADGVALMMDCGAGTVHALAKFRLPWASLTHLFISHFHVDHIGEMPALMHALKWGLKSRRQAPLTIIGPGGLDRVMAGFTAAFGSSLFEPGFPLTVRMLDPGASIKLSENCLLTVSKTPHTQESLAIRIDCGGASICYSGDTAYSEAVADFFRGCDLMVCECSYKDRNPKSAHLSIEDVSKMAARARARRLVVTHRYFESDDESITAAIRHHYAANLGSIVIGSDGMSFEL